MRLGFPCSHTISFVTLCWKCVELMSSPVNYNFSRPSLLIDRSLMSSDGEMAECSTSASGRREDQTGDAASDQDEAGNAMDSDEELDFDGQLLADAGADSEKSRKKTGVVYLQTLPTNFTVSKLRETLSAYADIGRIYLQAEKLRGGGKRRKRYTEGWVEFKSKSAAKRVAHDLNGNQVGGKRRSAAYDTLWTMKYLSGFKWTHLMEHLHYERRVEQQRLRAELSQAKRRAEHFAEQVQKGEKIRRLEEKMLKKGGLWERYQRQVNQRQVFRESQKKKSKELNASEGFMHMIFDKK